MDNITIDIYNKNAAKYADLDIDTVSLTAYDDFSKALPKMVSAWTMGLDLVIFQKNFLQTVSRLMLSIHQKK